MFKPTYFANVSPYQPDNPSGNNIPLGQTVQNFQNANDFTESPVNGIDRHVDDTVKTKYFDLRDYGYSTLDPNKNFYNPRRYPDPVAQRTWYPAKKTVKAPFNGSTTTYNPPHPFPQPQTGTNDVAFMLQVGL
jgi:hypothetical protein